jgi:hypothetical protein
MVGRRTPNSVVVQAAKAAIWQAFEGRVQTRPFCCLRRCKMTGLLLPELVIALCPHLPFLTSASTTMS